MSDDFCTAQWPAAPQPGPQAPLSRSAGLTVASFGPWQGLSSVHGFYRSAQRHLRPAFPTFPTREQWTRHLRDSQPALVACVLSLVQRLAAPQCLYEALDSSGVPPREAKRRGAGWLPGLAEIGWRNRLGWSEGWYLILAVNPVGGITGLGCGAASTKEQLLADPWFARRRYPQPQWPGAGAPAPGPYVVAKGFEGVAGQTVWQHVYGATVLCPPKRQSTRPWPKRLRRWLAGRRQIVVTVYDKRSHTFRLDRERPHDLRGFQARLAAKSALHNFCIWLHAPLGRPRRAFADLVAWEPHGISHQAF
jgi:hypothetical protein